MIGGRYHLFMGSSNELDVQAVTIITGCAIEILILPLHLPSLERYWLLGILKSARFPLAPIKDVITSTLQVRFIDFLIFFQ
jgi:hypothetical protein